MNFIGASRRRRRDRQRRRRGGHGERRPPLSLTAAVTLNLPVALGVPLIAPVGDRSWTLRAQRQRTNDSGLQRRQVVGYCVPDVLKVDPFVLMSDPVARCV